MRLVLVRHGETDWNQQGRVQGLGDQGLNQTGLNQAEALARALKDEKVAAIYTSPLKRARQTAQAISQFHQVEVIPVDGLKELDAGELDGLTYQEMGRQHGKFLSEWINDAANVKLPGGGCLADLQDQVWAAIEDITGRHKDKNETVVVVTHFFAILSIVCKAIGLNLSHYRRLKMDVAAICILDFSPRGPALTCLNDTSHLKGVNE